MAVQKEKPDLVIHLGDCWSDTEELLGKFPELEIRRVPGNCDWKQEPLEQLFEVEGVWILICHGHTYNVKMGLLNLLYAANEKGADVALFGHTHKGFYDYHQGVRLFNPGSIGAPRYQTPPSYGMIYLDGEKKQIKTDLVYLDTEQKHTDEKVYISQ